MSADNLTTIGLGMAIHVLGVLAGYNLKILVTEAVMSLIIKKHGIVHALQCSMLYKVDEEHTRPQ
jgi:hypothetical protein